MPVPGAGSEHGVLNRAKARFHFSNRMTGPEALCPAEMKAAAYWKGKDLNEY